MNYNKRTRRKNYIIDRISAMCGIFAFLISLLEKLEKIPHIGRFVVTILPYKNILIILLVSIILLRYLITVIPKYKINIQEKAPSEVNPSWFIVASIMLVSIALIIYEFMKIDNNSIFSKAQNSTITEEENSEESNENQDGTTEDINLSEEDETINRYIIRSYDDDIPVEVLKTLSYNELYYIRNGILAYAGLYFESGYYERCSWYTGDILNEEEEVWAELNTYQYNNILKIKEIEKAQ